MKEEGIKVETSKDDSIGAFYCWGAFWGWVIGMIFSKVYLLWAAWFNGEGMLNAGINGWDSVTPPLWFIAYSHPQKFHMVATVFFILTGIVFVRFLLKNKIIKGK